MRILMADDHGLVRDSIKPFLLSLSDGVEVVEASSLQDVLAQADAKPAPRLVLLDLHMPGMNGTRSIGAVRKAYPDSSVVILSGYADRETIVASLNEGARGFVPKTSRGKALVTALKLISMETYLPPSLLADTGTKTNGATPSPEFSANGSLAKLSPRELSILRLLIEGKTNKKSRAIWDLQEITIKVHLRNVYRKIEASNRADAVRIALTQGLQ